MSIEDFIISVYCLVDNEFKKNKSWQKLRKRGFKPKLSDAEVITMDIVGEFLGKDKDTSIYRYFKSHWHAWFPDLGSRSNYAKQSANLWQIKKMLQSILAKKFVLSQKVV